MPPRGFYKAAGKAWVEESRSSTIRREFQRTQMRAWKKAYRQVLKEESVLSHDMRCLDCGESWDEYEGERSFICPHPAMQDAGSTRQDARSAHHAAQRSSDGLPGEGRTR
jgi:hypothetical protein